MNDPQFIANIRKEYPSELRMFIAATLKKRELEQEMKQVNTELRFLQHKLLSIMDEQGKTSMKLGRQTVFRKREMYLNKRSDVTTEQVTDLLKILGYDEYVSETYDHQALRRDLAKQDETPVDLMEVFDIDGGDKLVLRNNL